MITILADHNIEGQALMLWRILSIEGWSELFPVQLVMFGQVGLSIESDDRTVWRFVQENRMLLLTANRNMAEEDSLEETIREENTPTSFPVLTIANVKRMMERRYRERCAERLVEILLDFDNCLGRGRIFLP